ncbi:MAG: response regulator, partial [Proteobacteria bacterium]
VTIKIEKSFEGHLRVEVKDTGMGISSEAKARLFKAFSQGDASTSRRFGGTGLGLLISKHLIELMGGAIHVESIPNEGSTFWFTLALKAGKGQVERARTESLPKTPVKQSDARILVAEDNAINQKVALSMLANGGYKATAVANGLEVLKALQDFQFDLILMDCQMPEMDGYEATRLIRSDEQFGHLNIPIIALTASAIKGDKEKCIAAGMNDYLSKPVAQRELIATLKKWLPSEESSLPVSSDTGKAS